MNLLRAEAVVDYEDEQVAVIRHDARNLPLEDESVDLIVTSPPYFALRSYRDGCLACGGTGNTSNIRRGSNESSTLDGGKQYSHKMGVAVDAIEADPDCPDCGGTGSGHFDGQIGSEDTPDLWLDALDECMVEWGRVLKPSGSVWINLGDKYAGTGGANSNTGLGLEDGDEEAFDNRGSARNNTKQTRGYRAKSLLGLPWRFAIRQIDNGWILRAEVVWDKPNGLPESVTDRVRRSHETWFHMVREPRYFSGVDEIREPHLDVSLARAQRNRHAPDLSQEGVGGPNTLEPAQMNHPLGRLPGSVWTIPGSRDMVVVTLETWRSVNGLCPTCGKTPTRVAGNGQAGETTAATGKAPATLNPEAKTGHTESPTDSISDPSPTDSPSTTSVETEAASTQTTSKQSLSKSTSAAAKKPTEPTASTATPSPTPTSTGAADTNDENAEPAISDVCECADSGTPRSVWTVPSEPLLIPDATRQLLDLPDHFAAFPQEFPRRIILGWSPTGICTECGEGRRPVVEKSFELDHIQNRTRGRMLPNDDGSGGTARIMGAGTDIPVGRESATITSYVCVCPTPDAPITPAVILDPFGGTGTVAGVAKTLGRYGISNDLSASYNRLAIWRITQSGHFTKTEQRSWADRQGQLL